MLFVYVGAARLQTLTAMVPQAMMMNPGSSYGEQGKKKNDNGIDQEVEEGKNNMGKQELMFEGGGSKEEVEGTKGDREGEVEQEQVESVSGHPGESSSAQRGRGEGGRPKQR